MSCAGLESLTQKLSSRIWQGKRVEDAEGELAATQGQAAYVQRKITRNNIVTTGQWQKFLRTCTCRGGGSSSEVEQRQCEEEQHEFWAAKSTWKIRVNSGLCHTQIFLQMGPFFKFRYD